MLFENNLATIRRRIKIRYKLVLLYELKIVVDNQWIGNFLDVIIRKNVCFFLLSNRPNHVYGSKKLFYIKNELIRNYEKVLQLVYIEWEEKFCVIGELRRGNALILHLCRSLAISYWHFGRVLAPLQSHLVIIVYAKLVPDCGITFNDWHFRKFRRRKEELCNILIQILAILHIHRITPTFTLLWL